MKLINRPRGQGKTTDAIRLAAETDAYMVVLHQQEAQRVADLAANMGLNIRFPLTFAEFFDRRYYGKGIGRVDIDNADMFLQQAFADITIQAVTMTDPEEGA